MLTALTEGDAVPLSVAAAVAQLEALAPALLDGAAVAVPAEDREARSLAEPHALALPLPLALPGAPAVALTVKRPLPVELPVATPVSLAVAVAAAREKEFSAEGEGEREAVGHAVPAPTEEVGGAEGEPDEDVEGVAEVEGAAEALGAPLPVPAPGDAVALPPVADALAEAEALPHDGEGLPEAVPQGDGASLPLRAKLPLSVKVSVAEGVEHDEGAALHVSCALPLVQALAVLVYVTVGAPLGVDAGERLGTSEGVSSRDPVRAVDCEALTEVLGEAERVKVALLEARGLTDGEGEADAHTEPLVESLHERENTVLGEPVGDARVVAQGDGDPEEQPDAEEVREPLGDPVATDAVAHAVGVAVTVHESVEPPLRLPLGDGPSEGLSDGVGDSVAESEGEAEGVLECVGERVTAPTLPLTLPLALEAGDPLRDADAHGDELPLPVPGGGEGDGGVVAVDEKVPAATDEVPEAPLPVSVPVDVTEAAREGEAAPLPEGGATVLVASGEALAPPLPVAYTVEVRLGDPVSEGLSDSEGVGEAQDVTLHDAEPRGVALIEPVADAVRGGVELPEALKDAEGEPDDDRQRLGEAVPVGDRLEDCVTLLVRGGVYERGGEGVHVAQAVAPTGGEGEDTTEGVLVPDKHGDNVPEPEGEPLALPKRDTDALAVADAPRERVRGTVGVGGWVGDALGQPLVDAEREGEGLPEAQLVGVRERGGEVEADWDTEGVVVWDASPEGVPLPPLPVAVGARGVALPLGEAQKHAVGDAVVQSEGEALPTADGVVFPVPLRVAEALPVEEGLLHAVPVTRSALGEPAGVVEAEAQPEPLKEGENVPNEVREEEGQELTLCEGAPLGEGCALLLCVADARGEGEAVCVELGHSDTAEVLEGVDVTVTGCVREPVAEATATVGVGRPPVGDTEGDPLPEGGAGVWEGKEDGEAEDALVALGFPVGDAWLAVEDAEPDTDETGEAVPSEVAVTAPLPVPSGSDGEAEADAERVSNGDGDAFAEAPAEAQAVPAEVLDGHAVGEGVGLPASLLDGDCEGEKGGVVDGTPDTEPAVEGEGAAVEEGGHDAEGGGVLDSERDGRTPVSVGEALLLGDGACVGNSVGTLVALPQIEEEGLAPLERLNEGLCEGLKVAFAEGESRSVAEAPFEREGEGDGEGVAPPERDAEGAGDDDALLRADGDTVGARVGALVDVGALLSRDVAEGETGALGEPVVDAVREVATEVLGEPEVDTEREEEGVSAAEVDGVVDCMPEGLP